jgi:hypothetical protein
MKRRRLAAKKEGVAQMQQGSSKSTETVYIPLPL